ncbi:hypothetical protein MY3296_006668 [Beauveria thailandica]
MAALLCAIYTAITPSLIARTAFNDLIFCPVILPY